MTQQINIIIFKSAWGLLVFTALVAQIIFADKPKKKADLLTDLLVITPFVVVLGFFYLEGYFGRYRGSTTGHISGTVIIAMGIVGYVLSHFYLRSNWSIFASIKEGQKLITNGPYRFVRHPMYSSMTLVVFGSGLVIDNYLVLLFTPIVFIVYYIRARKEEILLNEEFPEYNRYAHGTKMFIPAVL